MLDDAREVRLSPYLLAADVWQERVRSWIAARIIFGFLVAGLGILWSSKSSWAIVISVMVGVTAVLSSDGAALLQLGAELVGKSRFLGAMLPHHFRSYQRSVPAAELRPGDWICQQEPFEDKRRLVEFANDRARKQQQLREEAWQRENQLYQARQVKPLTDMSGIRDEYRKNIWHEKRFRHPPPIAWTFLQRIPKPIFFRIAVALPSLDGKWISVGYATGGVPRQFSYYELFYRHSAPPCSKAAQHEMVVRALHKLALELSDRWRLESDAIEQLVVAGHSMQYAHQAIRALLVAKLVRRNNSIGRWIRDLCGIFWFPFRFRLVPTRRIKLTRLGLLWVTADRSGSRRKSPPIPGTHGGSVTINFNDKVRFDHSIIGDNGAIHHYDYAMDPRQLVSDVVQFLENTQEGFPSDEAQEIMEALRGLRAALAETDLPVSKVRRSFTVLARVSEGLFVGGVGGSALYDHIKHFLAITGS
jgi:hypothetical protein